MRNTASACARKEQLKRLRTNVDILTMTATPIPRTLSMALEGLRDFSLITTAPSRRLAIKTFVKPFSEGSVREAVLRELKRRRAGIFLHNEVDTIENMRERWKPCCPKPASAWRGQLRERELEQVMRDFLQQRFSDVALFHHHRNRHRHPQRQHHHHQPRRQIRAGATAPASWERRPAATHQAYAYLLNA